MFDLCAQIPRDFQTYQASILETDYLMFSARTLSQPCSAEVPKNNQISWRLYKMSAKIEFKQLPNQQWWSH